MYDFDSVVPREGTCSIKFRDPKKVNEFASADAIPMWIADMDFRCAPEIMEELHARVDNGIYGYSSADDRYYEALSSWYLSRFGVKVEKETVVITNGVVSALNALVKILTKEGDSILILTPSYGPFDRAAKGAEGRNALYCRMKNDSGYFTVDFEDFEKKAADEKTALFILCNPHNPAGRVWSVEELERMKKICSDNGVKIVSDEIHGDITRSGITVNTMLSVCADDPSVVVCTAPSKTFNMAGNGMSNIIVRDPEIRDALRKSVSVSVSPFSLTATTAAYEKGAAWVDEMREYLDSNFAMLDAFLKEKLPECRFTVPEATYLAWVDMSAFGLTDEELEKRFAENGVLLEAGQNFVDNAEGWVRINIACPKSVLKEAFIRMEKALRG